MKLAPVFWFTGLSGSGKTTIARFAADILSARSKIVTILDGDAVRHKVTRHLGYSPEDIIENNRIIAQLCVDERARCDSIFVPVISPFERSRAEARKAVATTFYLVYCKASLDVVSRRDPKGLYKKAIGGELPGMIGIDEKVPYECPEDADLVLDTASETVDSCVSKFINFIGTK